MNLAGSVLCWTIVAEEKFDEHNNSKYNNFSKNVENSPLFLVYPDVEVDMDESMLTLLLLFY